MLHAVRVTFLNSEKQYEQDDVVVCSAGFNKDNASNIIDDTVYGAITPAQAKRRAEFIMAWETKGRKKLSECKKDGDRK